MPVEPTMRGLEDLTPSYEDGGRAATCGDVSDPQGDAAKAEAEERRSAEAYEQATASTTTEPIALMGDVAGHEFHGNQYTGGGGAEGGKGDYADREDERVAKRHEKEDYDHGVGMGHYAGKSPAEARKVLKERKTRIEEEERERTKKMIAKDKGSRDGKSAEDARDDRRDEERHFERTDDARVSKGPGIEHTKPIAKEDRKTPDEHYAQMEHHSKEADKAEKRGDAKSARAHEKASSLHEHAGSMRGAGYHEQADKWAAKAEAATKRAENK